MKAIFLLFTIVFGTVTYGGGFRFPNQSYSYAKLFLFNTHYEKGRPDQHIYRGGVYAQTKVGNGYNISEDMISKMNSIFKHGVDEIWMGLSKCSTPRHGIIFYNSKHKPIASISICFECERVNFWSSVKLHNNPDYDNFDIKKAEKQMQDLRTLFRANKMHVYEDKRDYKTIVDNNPNYKNEGDMNVKNTKLDSVFGHKITITEIKKWFTKPILLKRDTVEKRTMSDSYYFYKYTSKEKNDNTKFIVSGTEENSYLIQGEIYNPHIVLPNGVQVGMSYNDIITLHKLDPVPFIPGGGRNTPPTYETFILSGKKYKLENSFKNQTLVKVILFVWAE